MAQSTVWVQPGDIKARRHYRRSFTWAFDRSVAAPNKPFTPDLPTSTVRDIVREAFAEWAAQTDLVFVEVDDSPADFEVYFGPERPKPSWHTLATAELGGRELHFRDGWRWEEMVHTDTKYGQHLLSIAIHEIGHLLGLAHGPRHSIMSSRASARRRLHRADVERVRALYPRRQLVPIGGHVLDHLGHGNGYRVWRFDPTGADPLPGPAVQSGHWSGVDDTHTLIPMGNTHVLDWVPLERTFRLWSFDPTRKDPLPKKVQSGRWRTVDAGHVLVPVGTFVIDYVPRTGAFRVYPFDPSQSDPLPGPALSSGTWSDVWGKDVLVPMGSQHVLVWNPPTGDYRLYRFDPRASDPLVGSPIAQGRWSTIKSGHHLVPLGTHILDWVPHTGGYRLWKIDLTAADPLVRMGVVGTWSTVRGH